MISSLNIAVADDHTLFRKGLIHLVQSFDPTYYVTIEAADGTEFLGLLDPAAPPDLLILDIDMPGMDGFGLVERLARLCPQMPVLVVSMVSREESVIRMLRSGVKGYLPKDIAPMELHRAIQTVMEKRFFYTDFISGKMLDALIHPGKEDTPAPAHPLLNDRELQFLKLACSEDTYQEIADKMFLSLKTIDGYRASLFEKLQVKSRAGLVLYGIKSGLVTPV